MDITVSKSDLNKALGVTQSAVARKTTMPVLSNILLNAESGQLRISASDLEVSILAYVKAEIGKAGSTTVNAKVFSDIVRELPEGELKISVGEAERIEISTKGSRFKIIGLSAEEYPALPGLGHKVEGRIGTKLLSEMIGKTLYAASQDEARYNLTGVCFELVSGNNGPKIVRGKEKKGDEAKSLRLVATDGHRLAMVTRPVSKVDFDGRIIVPRKGLSEVKRVLDAENEEEVGIAIKEGFFLIETRTYKMAMRLIDGEYPDYGQVIPKDHGNKAKVNGASLAGALRRVVLMATDLEKCAKMTFAPETLRISSQSPELGEASEELDTVFEGEVFTVGFNAKYLTDLVAAFGEAENLVAELHGELGPGKFSPENDDSCLAIVMPMRL